MYASLAMTHGQTHIRCALLAALVWIVAVPVMGDISNPEYTYNMFYPKYARGRQPTVFDVGEFDSVNLYNGGLSLNIPLGTPLHASADLQWQIVLHNSSKFWSWDRRDTGKECEGQGYVVGDRYAGIGWALKMPHLHLRQEYDQTSKTWRFFLDGVFTPDGARHQLRRCLEGWDCRDGDPVPELVAGEFREYWYAADGSGWRVYRANSDRQFPSLTTTTVLVGEHGGLRYTFNGRYLLEGGDLGGEKRTDTDFMSQARGWYCTRIESIRWPGPRIETVYLELPGGSPIPSTITARDAAGNMASRVVADIDPIYQTISILRFQDAFFRERFRYEFAYERNRKLRIRAPGPAGWSGSCGADPDLQQFSDPFSYLTSLSLTSDDDQHISWGFGTFQEYADPPGEPDGNIDIEPKARVRTLILPTGARVEYEYAQWTFFYPALSTSTPLAPGPVLFDTAYCEALAGASPAAPPDPTPNPQMYSGWQKVWAVVDRKVVDTDNRLLEWTEYLRKGIGALVNLYEPFFDFSNTELSSPTGGPLLLPDPVADPDFSDHFYTGVAATIVRRHLVADHAPGNAAEDLGASAVGEGLVVDLPSARFDETVHTFATGRLFYDSDHDGHPSLVGSSGQYTDLWGTLPLEGRPLEVRHYRGPHFVDGEPPWFCPADDNQRLLKRSFFDYTLDREDDEPFNGVFERSCSNPLGGYKQYCGLRQESIRLRRETTWHTSASLLDDANDDHAEPLISGAEHWYETDDDCQDATECSFNWRSAYAFTKPIGLPRLPFNEVLGVSTSDFTASTPGGTDFDFRSTTIHDKTFTTSVWLPSLVGERITTLGEAASFDRTSTTYAVNGAVASTKQHLSLAGERSGDVVRSFVYYENHESGTVFGYGTPRIVTNRKVGADHRETGYDEGTTYSAKGGSPYVGPYTVEEWQLCPDGAEELGRCPAWRLAPAALGGVTGEIQNRTSINVFRRTPTSMVDGNGDGLAVIKHDGLGRLIKIVATDPSKSSTWLEYDQQLRWSEVRIEDESGVSTVVQRTEHDGLGRPVKAALRRAGSGGTAYEPASFRHQRMARDGIGTVWARSHWLAGAAISLPSSFASHTNWEIVASVDPFGRSERVVASDGGLLLSAYRGEVWSQSAVLDPDLGGLSRTFTLHDARGQVVETWEDKGAPPHDPPRFLAVDGMVPWRFVRGLYERDVAGRLTAVEIRGLDANNLGRTQKRSMLHDALGNLIAMSLPEYGTGNGIIRYEAFDALGNPKRTVLSADPYEARELVLDAAGRALENWFIRGGDRYLVGKTQYGTQVNDHEVGRVVRTTRFNPVSALSESCTGGCVPRDAIGVIHNYDYTNHGLLAGRTTEVSFGGATKSGGSQVFSLGYQYDRWGNIARIYYPELAGTPKCNLTGPTIDSTWGPVALASITDATTGHDLFYAPEYDSATGMLAGWTSAAGGIDGVGAIPGWVRHDIEVDGTRPRPTRISASTGTVSFFDGGSYQYDVAGNILSIGDWQYAYDDLGRLISAAWPGGSRAYSYDDFGNLVSLGARAIAVNALTNRFSDAAYDRRGNLISETVGNGWIRRTRFDLDNQLMAAWATGSGGPTEQFGFAYDLQGERVLKYRVADGSVAEATFSLRDQDGNVLTDFLWVPKSAGSSIGKWFRLADHVFLGRRPIIHRQSHGNYPVTYTTVVTDHLQSTRAEISDPTTSTASASFTYWPFGEFAERRGTPAAKHLFTAHEREDTGTVERTLSGLDYMHARYFSEESGRFLSTDPMIYNTIANSQNWNRYPFSHNNPVLYFDPDGRTPKLAINEPLVRKFTLFNRLVRLKLNTLFAKMGPPGEAVGAVTDLVLTEFAPESMEEFRDVANMRLATAGVPAVALGPKGEVLRSLTRRNLRENLARISGGAQKESHAHHLFSVKFEVAFTRLGFNIHDPLFATWWKRIPHLRNAASYNKDWERFLRRERTAAEVKQFARELAEKYRIKASF